MGGDGGMMTYIKLQNHYHETHGCCKNITMLNTLHASARKRRKYGESHETCNYRIIIIIIIRPRIA